MNGRNAKWHNPQVARTSEALREKSNETTYGFP
jgi:hypothetical protein